MNATTESFRERCLEVDAYFKLLSTVDRDGCEMVYKENRKKVRQPVRHEWVKTLKATSFLLLYNLVEATVRDVMVALYEKIATERLLAANASKELIEVWVEQEFRLLDKYSASPRNYHELLTRLVHAANGGSLLKIPCEDLPIAGNLDAGVISKLCSKHGIALKIPALARGGVELANIKRQRNDLAHGVLSFEECGRQITVAQLIQIRGECVAYLKSLLQHVKKFARARNYRRAS